jgi:hypothetical protein
MLDEMSGTRRRHQFCPVTSKISLTFSISQISLNLFITSASFNFEYLKIAHLDCIGSMILLDILQASANRVVLE